jgi:hypothetical protein
MIQRVTGRCGFYGRRVASQEDAVTVPPVEGSIAIAGSMDATPGSSGVAAYGVRQEAVFPHPHGVSDD